ncbi:MAG: RagB/SusD family nutrient uptake outer membrane protein [Candidatus Symbiothrix sp.]|jgi:hypothetical protein|nr:RagB/SusD family nutrient uptake outer membrane protein [Candidatus Symbiothrix sp.]
MNTKNKFLLSLMGILLLGSSCGEDFFNVDVTNVLTPDEAYDVMEADPSKLTSFVDAIYNVMVQFDLYSTYHDAFGFMAILHAGDMMTDDILMNKLHWFNYDYLHDNREWTYRRTNVCWIYMYTVINNANNVLDMISPDTDSPDILRYRGQCLALRGFAYYYLIQLYQHVYPYVSAGTDAPGVPLYFANNEGKENIFGRAPVSVVLAQIEDDLKAAVEALEQAPARSSKNNIDVHVANGLLARYYLLTQQWQKAYDAATAALDGYSVMPASRLGDGFMNIADAAVMWGFDHNSETTTLYASFFSHISNLTGGYSGLNYACRMIDRRLYDQIPATDARKQLFQNPEGTIDASDRASSSAVAWQLPYANIKFGYDGEFTMDYTYMRADEMVLIQAEALAQQGQGALAAQALKKLMEERDPAWNATSVTAEDVYLQRRIELWGEGFGYYDLKRLNKGIDRTTEGSLHDPALGGKIAVPALDKRWIYQIPESEIRENAEISPEENNE